MKIEIEIPDGYLLDGYTVKPVPVPLFTFAPLPYEEMDARGVPR